MGLALVLLAEAVRWWRGSSVGAHGCAGQGVPSVLGVGEPIPRKKNLFPGSTPK